MGPRHPVSRAERLRSRVAYRGQSGPEAKALARERFPEVAVEPAFRLRDLLGSASVQRYLNDETAVVDVPGAANQVLSSSTPLRAHGEPIDLDPTATSRGYEPKNGALDLAIPDRVDSPMRLGDSLKIRPVVASNASASLSGGAVFYPNVAADTDYLVRPTEQGAEAFWQLRSEDAPEAMSLRFDLPPGASLREKPGDLNSSDPVSVAGIDVVRGTQVLGSVSMPMAIDAQGKPVRTTMRISAPDTLEVSVPHRSTSAAYPILVDPFISDDYGPTYGYGPNVFDWHLVPNVTYSWFDITENADTMAVYAHPNMPFDGNSYMQYYLYSLPDTFYTRVDLRDYTHYPDDSYAYGGIYDTEGGGYEPGYTFDDDGLHNIANTAYYADANYVFRVIRGFCATRPTCYGSSTTDNNVIVFGLHQFGPTGSAGASASVNGVRTWGAENHPPTISNITHTNSLTGWSTDFVDTVSMHVADQGYGVQKVLLGGDLANPDQTQTMTCNGGHRDPPCPLSTDVTFDYDTANLPEGYSTVRTSAYDAVGLSSGSNWPVKIDRTPPTLAVTGTGSIDNAVFFGTNADITLIATDGSNLSNSTQQSGVRSLELKLDGQRVYYDSQPAADSASMQRTYNLDSSQYSEGTHLLTAIATDNVGQPTYKTWYLAVNRTLLTNVAVSGEFFNRQGGYVGPGTFPLTVTASRKYVGIKRVAVERIGGGEIASYSAACTGGVACPESVSHEFQLDTSDGSKFPEGSDTFRAVAYDSLDQPTNSGTWKVIVDRTPPSAPTSLSATYSPADEFATLNLSPGTDPPLPDGTPGAGVTEETFRYQDDDGQWSDWATVADQPELDAQPNDQMSSEVQSTDAAGNQSGPTASTLTVAGRAPATSCALPDCREIRDASGTLLTQDVAPSSFDDSRYALRLGTGSQLSRHVFASSPVRVYNSDHQVIAQVKPINPAATRWEVLQPNGDSGGPGTGRTKTDLPRQLAIVGQACMLVGKNSDYAMTVLTPGSVVPNGIFYSSDPNDPSTTTSQDAQHPVKGAEYVSVRGFVRISDLKQSGILRRRTPKGVLLRNTRDVIQSTRAGCRQGDLQGVPAVPLITGGPANMNPNYPYQYEYADPIMGNPRFGAARYANYDGYPNPNLTAENQPPRIDLGRVTQVKLMADSTRVSGGGIVRAILPVASQPNGLRSSGSFTKLAITADGNPDTPDEDPGFCRRNGKGDDPNADLREARTTGWALVRATGVDGFVPEKVVDPFPGNQLCGLPPSP